MLKMNKNKFYNEELPFVNSPSLQWKSYPEVHGDWIEDENGVTIFADDGRGNVPNQDNVREDYQKQKTTHTPQEHERQDKQRQDNSRDGKTRQAA